MKKLIIITLCLLSLGVNAQMTPTENAEPKHSVGMIFSSANGMGLTYRYLPGKNGFHISFIPITSQNYTFISAGLTYYRHLYSYGINRLYFQMSYAGMFVQNVGTVSTNYTYTNELYHVSRNKLGLGFAYELAGKHTGIDFYGGYSVSFVQTNADDKHISTNSNDKDGVYPNLSGGVAFFFRF